MSNLMKKLIIGNAAYEVCDAGAREILDSKVSCNAQSLTATQQAQARTNIGALAVAGGSMNGGINMSGHKISGLQMPVNEDEVANKGYVDGVDRKVDALADTVTRLHGEAKIVETSRGEVITVSDASDMPLAGLKVFGKTTQNGTPTPDSPVPLESVGDSGTVSVTACGHNVFDEQMEIGHINAETGEAYTDSAKLRSVNYIPILPATKYYLYISGTEATIRYYDSDKNYIGYGESMWHYQNRVVTTPENARFMRLVLSAAYGTVYRNNIAINYPETVTEYEPYVSGGSVTVTPVDSSGNSLHLPGIPVNSGGNYTDSSGQQWICDEVDFEKGVYVQRVGTIVFDGSDDEAWHADTAAGWGTNSFYTFWNGIAKNIYESLAVCSRYKVLPRNSYNNTLSDVVILSDVSITVVKASSANTVGEWRTWLSANPVTLNAVLLNPIEHALPADQLAGYAALHSNYPNTTVFNDRNAGMEVKYVADTKLYIDKKFDQLEQALLSTGSYI